MLSGLFYFILSYFILSYFIFTTDRHYVTTPSLAWSTSQRCVTSQYAPAFFLTWNMNQRGFLSSPHPSPSGSLAQNVSWRGINTTNLTATSQMGLKHWNHVSLFEPQVYIYNIKPILLTKVLYPAPHSPLTQNASQRGSLFLFSLWTGTTLLPPANEWGTRVDSSWANR